MMAIETVTGFVLTLIPVGAVIVMIFYASSILGSWIIDRKLDNVLQRKGMADDQEKNNK